MSYKKRFFLTAQEEKNELSRLSENEDFNFDNVETVENDIYFYCDVSEASIFKLVQELKALEQKLLIFKAKFEAINGVDAPEIPIKLHICSDGGDLASGLAAADTIKSLKVPVWTIVEGAAASAATLMSICGAKRFITPHSHMLIHQLSTGFWGAYEDLLEHKENCARFMKSIKCLYLQNTNISEAKLNKILKKDLWFDAQTCLKLKLVDVIQ